MKFLFMDSSANLTPIATSDVMPVNNEATITINWALPLNGETQGFLFQRIRKAFERATAIVDNPQDRKRYRMSEEDLFALRNLMCLWFQIRDFCSTRISSFDELDNAICSGSTKDHELQQILDCKPVQFGISMLPSSQREALEAVRQQEEGQNFEVERERLAVRDARWSFFQAALARDQAKLRMIQEAPAKIDSLRHRKRMQWRVEQAKLGEKVIKAYKDKFLRCDLVNKAELAQQKINEFRAYVVPCKCIELVQLLVFLVQLLGL